MPTEELTQKEFARRIDRTPRLVRKLTNQGILPRLPNKKYPWPEAHDAWIEFKQTERERRYSGGDRDLREERARKVAADADLAELKLAQLRSELVHIDDLEKKLRTALHAVDTGLRNAPARHANDLAAAAEIEVPVAIRILEDVVEEVREALRREGQTSWDDDDE